MFAGHDPYLVALSVVIFGGAAFFIADNATSFAASAGWRDSR